MNYKDFKKIIVTGAQRSGTTFVAQAIANTLGYAYIDETEFNVHDMCKAIELIDSNENFVMQAPGLLSLMWYICPNDTFKLLKQRDIAVVLVKRDLEEIHNSEKRIDWKYNNIELIKLGYKEGDSAGLKYQIWENIKGAIKYPFEVNYTDFENHPMFISKELRANFKPKQTI